MRAVGLLLVALFALVTLPACPPEGLTNTCHFQGETTNVCGRCIHEKCQNQVDSECASVIKSDQALAALDKCASGQGCSLLYNSYGYGLGDCVQTACIAECPDTATPANGTARCTGDETGCSCTVSTTSNGLLCPVVDDGSICCASTSYPSSGTCTCRPSSAPFACSSSQRSLTKCQ